MMYAWERRSNRAPRHSANAHLELVPLASDARCGVFPLDPGKRARMDCRLPHPCCRKLGSPLPNTLVPVQEPRNINRSPGGSLVPRPCLVPVPVGSLSRSWFLVPKLVPRPETESPPRPRRLKWPGRKTELPPKRHRLHEVRGVDTEWCR